MDHMPGKLDFLIEEKDFTVTAFRRKPSAVWAFVETPGHIAFFTRRGHRICALTSIETHACLSGNYEAEIAEVERISREYREKRRAARRIKQNGAEDI